MGFVTLSNAENIVNKNYLITEDSIGVIKVGMPLKVVMEEVQKLGYTIKNDKTSFFVYDERNLPLITFTVFNSHPQTKPVRTIKTTSSRFTLSNGMKLIGASISALVEEYYDVSIFRVTANNNSPELVDFKGWPFSKSITKDGYIIKYEVVLNKITDENGKPMPVGIYSNNFSLYTSKYLPEAIIESFQIEAIEPKIKFENK